MADNPSFVLQEIERVTYEQRPIPDISDDELLIEVKKTGICGSDVHYLVHGRIGDFIVEKPMVLGHESAGVVSKVGAKVSTHKIGDRVAIEPGPSFNSAQFFASDLHRQEQHVEHAVIAKWDGTMQVYLTYSVHGITLIQVGYQLCPNIAFAATPPYDGTLARYYRVPHHLAYHLPSNVTLEDGAMIEPLAVGVHSVSTLGQFRANQSVAVFGCGPVGLLCMAVAKAMGASRVIGVDIVPTRLEFAKNYAATETYLPLVPLEGESKTDYSRRNAEEMMKVLGIDIRGSKTIDLVIDASGAETSIQTGLYILKTAGTFVQVGMGNPNVTVNLTQIGTKELVYKGSFRYGPGDYPLAIDLVAQGRIDLKPLVTHRYAFDNAIAAFQATRKGLSEDGKILIKALISGPDVSVDVI